MVGTHFLQWEVRGWVSLGCLAGLSFGGVMRIRGEQFPPSNASNQIGLDNLEAGL